MKVASGMGFGDSWVDVHCSFDQASSAFMYSTSSGRSKRGSEQSTVLVAGACGGVGQLLCASLLKKGARVRALCRDPEAAAGLLGEAEGLELVVGDTRHRGTLGPALEGASAVCCATGTTAFPSKRWKAGNSPATVDRDGVRNLVAAARAAEGLERFVLCTSAGVERFDAEQSGFSPYVILNLFGVLEAKRLGEEALERSGLDYTIFRPARLTDGPYTSYDLNTLMKGTAGTRQGVELRAGDCLDGEMSRVWLAEAMAQAVVQGEAGGTFGRTLCCQSVDGAGPGEDAARWAELFRAA